MKFRSMLLTAIATLIPFSSAFAEKDVLHTGDTSFLVTNTSAAIAALAWMFAEWYHTKKPTLLGIASGVVAGLVAITPAAGFVNMPAALIIGLVAGVFGFYSVSILKHRLGYDDSLDAFGVHGMCGA